MAERVMGADHIAAAGGSFEPQRPYNFQVIFPAELDDLRLAVVSLPVPVIRTGKITIPWLNEERHVPGAVTVEQANLVLTDYVKPAIAEKVQSWFGLVYDPDTGAIGYASALKRDLVLQMFGPDRTAKREWTMRGCFPLSFNAGEFNMGTRDAGQQLTIELSIDRCIPTLLSTA